MINGGRSEFEEAYRQQIQDDLRELKNIGELEYNFDNLATQVHQERAAQFGKQLMPAIDGAINQNKQIYERQENIRKTLHNEINRLKERLKLEMESRRRADKELDSALKKYMALFEKEMEAKRQDIRNLKP